jgi:glycosyltransferase involved in cell wall biosynthesis
MKICFKLIKAGSGSDTWTYQMVDTLNVMGIDAIIEEYPHYFQYFPFFINSAFCEDIDIVHTNSWNGFAFKQKNTPMITTEHLVVHDPLISPYKSFAQKAFHKIVYQFEKRSFHTADAITSVSQYSNEKVEELFNVKSNAIHNGIDTKKFTIKKNVTELHPEIKNKIKLLFVGNFTERKGANLLPKILDKLDDRFVLLTTTGLRNKNVCTHKKIISIGKLNQEQLVDYYNYSDIFLFPTRLEGLSLTTLEAMACGMPIITTDCFSMPELVVHEKGGFLCDVDDVDDFVLAINTIVSSPELGPKMGMFNRDRVENSFSIQKMAEAYINLYKQVIKKHV